MSRAHAVVVPEGWLSRGEAFVRGRGVQLAVFGGIPGEPARIRVYSGSGHQDRARVITPVEPHPRRVEPPCPRWGPCGHCPWMHLDERGQLDALRALAAAALAEASVDLAVAPAHPVSEGARVHALELVAGLSDEGHPRLGVVAREGRGIVAIPECLRVTDTLRALMGASAGGMRQHDLVATDGKRPLLAGVRAWQAPDDGEVLVVLDVARVVPAVQAFADGLSGAVGKVRGIWAQLPGDASPRRLLGAAALDVDWDGLRLRLTQADPWPVLPDVERAMDAALVVALGVTPGDTVIDLVAGPGRRTLRLARAAGWALGIEDDADRLVRFREAAAASRVPAEFAPGPVAAVLDEQRGRLAGRRPLVHVDVGRGGMEPEVRQAVCALDARRVALTGTNPRAVAREIAAWLAAGWRADPVEPWMILPWSPLGALRIVLHSPDSTSPARRAPRRRTVRSEVGP